MILESGIMHLLTKRRNMKDRTINPLIRIADTLDEILRLVKKDMEDSKARITEQWDKELDKKDLPFPEVEEVDDLSKEWKI
jgi:hypothetical protein